MKEFLFTLIHWLHLAGAVSAVGGAIMLRVVVHPATLRLDDARRAEFLDTMLPKLRKFTIHSVLTLFATGVINLFRVIGSRPDFHGLYGGVFMLKFLLAMIVFAIAIALVVPGEAFEKFQARRPFWLLVNIPLGLVVLLLSAWLRMMPEREAPQIEAAPFFEPGGSATLESPALRRLVESEAAEAAASGDSSAATDSDAGASASDSGAPTAEPATTPAP